MAKKELSPVGIDFGTTNSSIGYALPMASGLVEARAISFGPDNQPKFPTAVFVTSEHEYIVGYEALELGARDPSRLYVNFKQNLGETLSPLPDGTKITADLLTEKVFQKLLDHAHQQNHENIAPVICHPVGILRPELELISQKQLATTVEFLTEPEAALYYAHNPQ